MKMKEKTALLQTLCSKAHDWMVRAKLKGKETLASNSGEGFFDSGIKVLIVVVVGGLLLVSFYALWKNNLIPTITSKIEGMFNYSA